MSELIPSCHTVRTIVGIPTQHQASNKISGNQTEGRNLPWITRKRSVCRNRDVKVNVKPEKDEWPSL